MYLELYLPITPQPKLRPRMGPHGAYTPSKTKKAEQDLRTLISKELPHDFVMSTDEALELKVVFQIPSPKGCKRTFPSVRPDLDNYLKLLMDAMNGLVWKDDAQVCYVSAFKTYIRYVVNPDRPCEGAMDIVISSMS